MKTMMQDKFSPPEGSECFNVPSFRQTMSSLPPGRNCANQLKNLQKKIFVLYQNHYQFILNTHPKQEIMKQKFT